MWSFNDCLTPELILESPREIKSISVCPLDGNIIIGGLANGQVSTIICEPTGIEVREFIRYESHKKKARIANALYGISVVSFRSPFGQYRIKSKR